MTYKPGENPITACEVNALIETLDRIHWRQTHAGLFDDEWGKVTQLLTILLAELNLKSVDVSDTHGVDCACTHYEAPYDLPTISVHHAPCPVQPARVPGAAKP